MLLAIVMVLVGCDTPLEPKSTTVNEQAGGSGQSSGTSVENDSVPEVTPAKLVSITVTPPTRTVYSVGEEFDPTDMVVTATYDDGEPREVTGWTTNFDAVTSEKGVNKNVTVSYTEGEITKQDSFTVVVFPEGVKILTDYTSPNHTDNTWTYVAFGEWPQSEVKDFSPKTAATSYGIFKDNYYEEDDGKYVKVNDKYFKVEPIIWRVLNAKDGKYNTSENPLLLAEKILIGGIEWDDNKSDYKESNIRKWLNGNSGSGEQSDYSGDVGFLQTAFTTDAQKLIVETIVDNTARSTNPDSNAREWKDGENEYACGNTTDKIFLLSEQEATTEEYGFAVFDEYVGDSKGTTTSTRIRVTTDYANATEAYQNGTTGYGGWWWLRSPCSIYKYTVLCVDYDGDADINVIVEDTEVGVVPALSISMNGD